MKEQEEYFYDNGEPLLVGDKVWVDSGGYNTYKSGIVIGHKDGLRVKDYEGRLFTVDEFRDNDCWEEIHKIKESKG